jgi:bacterial microcompartment shell protein
MLEKSIGLIELPSIAAGFQYADKMLEVWLTMALGGKAFCTMTGDVGSVQAAMAAGRRVSGEAGVLVNAVVLSRPHFGVCREVV